MVDQYIKHTQEDFAHAWGALLPYGAAWPRDDDSVVMRTVYGLAGIWSDVAINADTLLQIESDPRLTISMLVDWERNFGLPDDCLAEPLTIAERHAALIQRLTLLGGQSRAFFVNAAYQIGYTIAIQEFSPFICGLSQCGDTKALNPDTPSAFRWEIGPPEIRYYWRIHVNALRISYFHTSSGECGRDRLLSIGLATDLECLLRRYKPGHTDIIFDYSAVAELDYSQPVDSGYIMLGVP